MNTAPTTSAERIQSLDFLRGFAILGILIMNIQSFAMPGAAYLNPMAYGSMEGANKWVWIISHLLADQKFMTIFSILFGAGIILFTERALAKSGKSAGLHYKRTFWLLVIGLVHAHIIWYGDILVPYAICAFIVYLFRKAKPKTLLITGILVVSVHTLFYVFLGNSMQFWPPESVEMAKESWIPAQSQIIDEINAVTGSLGEQISHNSAGATFLETAVFLMVFLWRAGGLMLIGMALYKWGVLSAKKSTAFYRRWLVLGLIIGLSLTGYGIYSNYQHDFSFEYSMYLGSQFNYWGSLFTSFAYICGIMLLSKSSFMPWLKTRMAAVGQMALTNYLMQSIICVLIFWGVGFELFGKLERTQQIYIVLIIWLAQMFWSKPWLKRFRFGPFEWLWRSLTYGKKQPMRRKS